MPDRPNEPSKNEYSGPSVDHQLSAEQMKRMVMDGPEQQEYVQEILRQFGSIPVKELEVALIRGEHEVKAAVAQALAELVPSLIKNVGNTNSLERADAAKILGDLGLAAASALPTLEKVIQEEGLPEFTREKVEEAIEKIRVAITKNEI